ncbi:MAG: phage minor head protein [Erysipelotrichaceae bacterium]
MNQRQYTEYTKLIDTIRNNGEREIEVLFLEEMRLLSIQLGDMFERYSEGGIVSRDEMMKFNRLQQMESEFIQRMKVLTQKQEEITKRSVENVFIESYQYNMFSIESVAKVAVFGGLATSLINEYLYDNMSPTTWRDTINEDNNKLIRGIRSVLITGITNGQTLKEMSDEMKDQIRIGQNRALTTIQSETHRADEDASLKSMRDAKDKGVIMKKRWLATLDSRTRKTHQHLDGQTIDIDDYFVSKSGRKALAPRKFGVAKEDINCRCRIISILDGLEPEARRARDEVNQGTIINYKNYNEWKKNNIN